VDGANVDNYYTLGKVTVKRVAFNTDEPDYYRVFSTATSIPRFNPFEHDMMQIISEATERMTKTILALYTNEIMEEE
jgi:hypothetical protein